MDDIVYKPLNEAIGINIPEQKESLIVNVMKYGEFIHKSSEANGNSDYEPIYDVPEGKVFLLLTASLAVRNQSATSVRSFINIDRVGEILYVTLPYSTFTDFDNFHYGTASICPSMPLLIRGGSSIEVFNQVVQCVTYGTVTGYLIDAATFWKSI